MPIDENKEQDEYEVAEDAQRIGEGEPVDNDAEAHRYAEFEDLKDRIEGIARMIETLSETMRDGFAQFASVAVDSGAVIRDDAEAVGLADVDEETGELTPIEDLVFFD